MNPVELETVSFAYEESPVFQGLTLGLPAGVTSFAGPNGTGKSTLMLLASGRLLPTEGVVKLHGVDTRTLDEEGRNRLASVVYQNMEFETEEPLGDLLDFVAAGGFLPDHGSALKPDLVRELELEGLLAKKTDSLSKGQMQRAVMAFALLYGSRLVVMDEPVFALEADQKRRALGFVAEWSRQAGISFLYSAHELELTRDFSDRVLLFSKDGSLHLGPTDRLLTPELLEQAYQVPHALLHQRESLYRSMLRGETPA